jgi:membrane protease YdiL (CAAX protease family)
MMAEPGPRRREVSWPAVAAVIAALGLFNVLNNWLAPSAYLLTRPAELLVLITVALQFGLTADDLGLARATWARGLRWAAAGLAMVAVVFVVAVALPATRVAFLDRRGDMSVAAALFEATVPVFVGTVLLEEFAFRGVLWGMVNRLRGPTYATAVSSIAFGLWHVLPSHGLQRTNRAVSELLGAGPEVALVVALFAVAFAALAGVVFCELRRRSGSLLAPIGLHWATNGLGYVLSALAWALAR